MICSRVLCKTRTLCKRSVLLKNVIERTIPDKSRRCISTTLITFNTERKYSEKHEWVKLDGKVGTIGITHYAQESLGDVVFAQLPDIGTTVTQNEECGALESVKAASELYSPVSGKVVEKNGSVEETPALINQSCYDKGWLFKIELTTPTEVDTLMDEETYEEFLKKDNN